VPEALRLQAYILGNSLVPMLQLLHVDVAISGGKRPRSSQDETILKSSQCEAVFDQLNLTSDIGPNAVLVKRSYNVRREISVEKSVVKSWWIVF